ncbi:MAG: hypothetical protein JWL77_7174 [Chthonomonadaceae bacterium]|nr:hypothetical protein [Chthonomonadaceae bacterium]
MTGERDYDAQGSSEPLAAERLWGTSRVDDQDLHVTADRLLEGLGPLAPSQQARFVGLLAHRLVVEPDAPELSDTTWRQWTELVVEAIAVVDRTMWQREWLCFSAREIYELHQDFENAVWILILASFGEMA